MMNKLTILLAAICSPITFASRPTIRGSKNSDERRLQTQATVNGECTVANFSAAVGGQATLASWLQVANDAAAIQAKLDVACAEALEPNIDLSRAIGKGPQFLKNFLDGGTTWNENYETADGQYKLSVDAAIIKSLDEGDARKLVFGAPDEGAEAAYPGYFSNFYNGDTECRLGAIQCCYTTSRFADKPLEDNAEMCAHDMTLSAKSNHIKAKSYTIYKTKPTDDTYCSAFAWEEGTFGDAVKYNTLFHMAMKDNLYDNGRVRNIPGAPMCGCAEQMPIITNSACTKAKEGYVIDSTGNVGVSISWEDCGTDFLDHYVNLPGRGDMEKFFMKGKIVGDGQCEKAIDNFMNDRMLVH